MLGSQKKEEGASGASGSGVASTARDLASKAVAIVPFSNLSEAIEVGRAKTEAQNARAAASEARDRDDPTIAFRDHDSARAWENRKSESIEHREKIKNKRASVRRDPTEKRLEKYMMGLGSRVQGGEQTAQKLKPLTPVFAFILHGLYYGTKYLLIVFDYAWQLYEILPKAALTIIYGTSLCFFGGVFPMAIAGLEAFYAAGWRRAYYSTLYVYDESRHVSYALELDDYEDANRDGVADVDQISSSELVQRKTLLAFATVKKPEELQVAFANVWAAYLAVLATLKFEFAKTTAFAIAIASSMQFFVLKLFGPPLAWALPKDMDHWVPVFLDTITHVIALVVAMLVQRVVSAIVSGLRGGFMASQTAIRFTNEMGYSKIDEETSLIDESAGLLIAACGITFQLMQGFALPFPFNLLLLPVVIFEYVLQWQVTFQNDYKA
ncbi:hypothetical protein KFE25_005623 [Diacronema lutheri]|uniref:Uncharacterized protein n=1 Tax=Diacronema lutheri TaxID=2081491 RepID=A0A8J5XFD2_DIALT|nr:hypothetical protein KFE25_005623 [Diacronema lutheri]